MSINEQKLKTYQAWLANMQFIAMLAGEKFEPPTSTDPEELYDFMMTYNQRQAQELNRLREQIRNATH